MRLGQESVGRRGTTKYYTYKGPIHKHRKEKFGNTYHIYQIHGQFEKVSGGERKGGKEEEERERG